MRKIIAVCGIVVTAFLLSANPASAGHSEQDAPPRAKSVQL